MDQGVAESSVDSGGLCIGEYRSSSVKIASSKACDIYGGIDGQNRRVLIKKLKPRAAAAPESVKRIKAEADALKAVSSIPVAAVPAFLDLVDEDGDVALVEEFIAGAPMTTPRRRDNFARWRPYEVRRFLDHMLQTLREVHRQGYVHNDIRPANILCRPSDPLQPFVLIDFGDAERRGPAGRYRGGANAGNTVPAPSASYTAPERADGGSGYYCSDLFSLGVIGIQLLTGAELKDLMWGVQGHVILPLYPFTRDDVLERVLVSMTCRFPWQRYQAADEALAALTKRETGEILDKPVDRPRTARTVIAIVALILLLWLGSIAWKSAVAEYCRQSVDCHTAAPTGSR